MHKEVNMLVVFILSGHSVNLTFEFAILFEVKIEKINILIKDFEN